MMTMMDDASRSQVRAADPSVSVWLHANAGSGKTKVLIDRVARLLLAGVEPQQVLCLTYTKAAAAEMQNRLFQRLGAWAMMPDAGLVAALNALGPDTLAQEQGGSAPPDLARARQLFARAIETPGGLRIQTIHSFCATLLRRFPLEAGVSPQFTELDDRSARLLRSDITEEIAAGPGAGVVDRLARAHTGDDLDKLLQQIVQNRARFVPILDDAGARLLFGLTADFDAQQLIDRVLLGDEADLLAMLIPALQASSPNDVKAAEKLGAIDLSRPAPETLKALEGVLLTGDAAASPYSAKTGSFPTKAVRQRLAQLMPRLDALMLRIEAARDLRLALVAAEKTAALHGFAALFLPIYAARKAMQGTLDFDDLITRARALLTDPSVAQWVLYRLDGGIDHILVDEAQDTSPDQWQVLERLSDALLEGGTLRSLKRTIFVVGDKKQSIYSFQGADVAAFDAMKGRFGGRLAEVQTRLQEQELVHSFRSSPAILAAVDATFARDDVTSMGGQMRHVAQFSALSGRVELWAPIEKAAGTTDPDPTDPVDLTTDEHHSAIMGRRVADWIAAALARGMQVPVRGDVRPARPGDFLVLVKRRGDIFGAVIAACKAKGLAIAGADRLKLGAELAVKDVLALLSFLANDGDDLSLAAVLRSPLGGLTEAQLYDLAYGRKATLWQSLVAAKADHADVVAMLADLRAVTDLLRPHDLIDRALTRHGGRLRLVARLGPEAEDAIDELLTQSLAYEATEVPSVTGFLTWLDAGEIEVKRQMETDGGMIRVMTVHGAKGLEAPVVILPDTISIPPTDTDQVIPLEAGSAVWGIAKADAPPLVTTQKALRKQRRDAEADRLLYVAMTRAQSCLVIGAAGQIKPDADNWYLQVRDGLLRLGAQAGPDGGLIYTQGDWPPDRLETHRGASPADRPDWAIEQALPPPPAPTPLSPSQLGGQKALPGEGQGSAPDSADAIARGSRLHALLEHLPQHPPGDWPLLAQALGAADLLSEADLVIAANPTLFGPNSLAEVGITADLGGRRLLGSIDRLIVTDDHVLAVDFKSNHVIPASAEKVPEGILRQMGAYAAALAQVYPDKQIATAILWTQTGRLLQLPRDIVRVALDRALSLDDGTDDP